MTREELAEEVRCARAMPEDRRDAAILAPAGAIVQLAEQRDRALALLDDDAMWGSGCLAPFVEGGDDSKCLNDPPCWEHRRRALLAEVDL